jgi:HD superfamily phosphohydrolase
MTITDRIYGVVDIENGLIADLIDSGPIQRLKSISQDGATHFIDPVFDANRFEHSFGAWYLSNYFKRPIEEQVACLLHDVPHTAFSHVVDFVMEDDNQEFHDRFLKEIIGKSDIPDICAKHGLDIDKVLRKEDYYLLDNRTPELSFDRWDYFMRDGFMLGLLPQSAIDGILASVKLEDGQFHFEDVRQANLLCITSLMVCQLGYVSANSHGSWFLMASALKAALRQGVIQESDLFGTDDLVMGKLRAANDATIDGYLQRLTPKRKFAYADKEEAEFYGRNKARYIDPRVVYEGGFVPVSELTVGLKDYIDAFKARCQYIGVNQVQE